MAHFAKIDSNNIVTEVIVVSDALEHIGSQWCKDIFGGRWIQTSYNGKIRKNFAGIGYFYDEEKDAFIPPKPYNSWILDENTYNWISSIPSPDITIPYYWDEDTLSWKRPPII